MNQSTPNWHLKSLGVIFLLLFSNSIIAQSSGVIINEVNSNNQVELKNTGTDTLNIVNWWLCNFPTYERLSNLSIVCGSLRMGPGDITVLSDWTIDEADGELGLYSNNAFGDTSSIVDYVEWGSSGHQRSGVAVDAGIWDTNSFVPAFNSGQSLLFDGSDGNASSWAASMPSLCFENENCDVNGGMIEGGPFEFCVGDDITDNVSGISLTGNTGANSEWVVTDEQGFIIGIANLPENINFDGAGTGNCLIWHISFEDSLMGYSTNMSIDSLMGCFDLSDSIPVSRIDGLDGGSLSGTDAEFCVGDGIPDRASGITVSGSEGSNSAWVITDEEGTILGLPILPDSINFDTSGMGVCLIWHLSYDNSLMGLETGNNTSNLVGCFDFSDSIRIVRNLSDGGTLTGGHFSFCVGDSIPDFASGISLSGNFGANSAWVITDEMGTILGLPNSPDSVDFDTSGIGVCLIWHLSYEDSLQGLELGSMVSNLMGCHDFSDSIRVSRNQLDGGMLDGNDFAFCAGDGSPDHVSGISLSGNSGANSAWVITDEQGTILDLPPHPDSVDFDSAGNGVCLIWHLSYADSLMGLELDSTVNNLMGCFDFSDSIRVVRTQPNGGMLAGNDFSFCVGDSIPDFVSDISVNNHSGTNTAWVITDEMGKILGLPASPDSVNFDSSGVGVCLIWHLSYEDSLMGLDLDSMVTNLMGCYDFSDSIRVARDQLDGGMLDGEDFAFCVGDGMSDHVSGITLTGNSGANSAWVITDEQGTILGLPPHPDSVDFDTTGNGICLIWHISHADELMGLELDSTVNNLVGCFDLSDSIRVVRTQTDGGMLIGGNFSFCPGDSLSDQLSGVTVMGNSGTNSAWVVTNEMGTILDLPISPDSVNFDTSGMDLSLIWHLSYEDSLIGLEIDSMVSNLMGCFDFSDSIPLVREQLDGGMLDGDDFTFCVGDGIPDQVSGITLTGNSRANSAWVITDEQGIILDLPPHPDSVDFDPTGNGVCLIWHLSYTDSLMGLQLDSNVVNLSGCFDFSDSIRVVRTQPDGGMLTGGDFSFTVGDSIPDRVAGVAVMDTVGSNSAWVITDEMGTILGLPSSPDSVDFDTSGVGICLIWHLSYEDPLLGLELDSMVSNIMGCFDFSDSIRVERSEMEPEIVDGGMLTGNDFTFCVGDGIADQASGITLSGNTGANSAWVITDEQGTILGLPPHPDSVDFDAEGNGICLIWHLSYADSLMGLQIDSNVTNLTGSFDFSDSIRVVRNQPDGGMLIGGDFSFTVGDSIPDRVAGVAVMNAAGSNSAWVITDEMGTILGLPASPDSINFDTSGVGICLIWHLSYEDSLQGLELDSMVTNIMGCFDFSDSIRVERTQLELLDGGMLAGDDFTFCVGDSIADQVSGITLTGNTGTNSAWVITDEQGTILGLPPHPDSVDFDAEGNGICLIWHLSYADSLMGLQIDSNVTNLTGSFDFSDSIRVVRNQPDGGMLSGGDFSFCAGDSIPDYVSGVEVMNTAGSNSAWVITDEMGTILGLPVSPDSVDFNTAGSGVCLIWHLSYEDSLIGLELDSMVNNLMGCYDFSDSIRVVRNQPDGGMLSGGDFSFCVGDSIPDQTTNISIMGNQGTNSAWVVTDEKGNILGLPPHPDSINFDTSGRGTCLIWHLSYEDSLIGLDLDANTRDLLGCFDFSDSIRVVRNQPDGGILDGEDFSFCVGDSIPDFVSGISLLDNFGANSAWVITDENGTILGLPPHPDSVDFNDAGNGVCLIWHLSYEDSIQGLELNSNTSDLSGCFDFSNSIQVIRNQPDGGVLEGGPFQFCVSDDIIDNISDISLTGMVGAKRSWIVTDEEGKILGLPPRPESIDFEGVGAGECSIWNISFFGNVEGMEVNGNINDLQGCFDLSNPISVIRFIGADCDVLCSAEGGVLTGGPITFCVGDSIPDYITDLQLSGNSGTDSLWMVTNDLGRIVALPNSPEDINFDSSGLGTCFIWHVSFVDSLIGLEIGAPANRVKGCVSFSNSIAINRVIEGEACDLTSTKTINPASIEFTVSPNPVYDQMLIDVSMEKAPAQLFVEVRTSLGQLIFSKPLNRSKQIQENLDVSRLPNGLYIISLHTEDSISSQRFLKQ